MKKGRIIFFSIFGVVVITVSLIAYFFVTSKAGSNETYTVIKNAIVQHTAPAGYIFDNEITVDNNGQKDVTQVRVKEDVDIVNGYKAESYQETEDFEDENGIKYQMFSERYQSRVVKVGSDYYYITDNGLRKITTNNPDPEADDPYIVQTVVLDNTKMPIDRNFAAFSFSNIDNLQSTDFRIEIFKTINMLREFLDKDYADKIKEIENYNKNQLSSKKELILSYFNQVFTLTLKEGNESEFVTYTIKVERNKITYISYETYTKVGTVITTAKMQASFNYTQKTFDVTAPASFGAYDPVINNVSITYMNGNDVYQVVSGDFGNIITTAVTEPTQAGKTFVGWYMDKSFNTEFLSAVFPSYSIKVYAKFQ